MPSPKKALANKINAQASTGPKTARGKAVASANATRHGILSQELMLPHESPADFDGLLSSLITELGAQGTLECALVERIAVAIWRQRRLVRAERQDIQKQNEVDATSGAPSRGGGREHKVLSLTDAQIIAMRLAEPFFAENLDAIERELLLLPTTLGMSTERYVEEFPLMAMVFPRPIAWKGDIFSPEKFEQLYGPPDGQQRRWLAGVLEARAQRSQLQSERAGWRAVSIPSNTESLARYQAALDNEWYKAMRAFREARQHRLRTLDSVQNYETNPNPIAQQ